MNNDKSFKAKVIIENSDDIDSFVEHLQKLPEFNKLTDEQKIKIASSYPIITSVKLL